MFCRNCGGEMNDNQAICLKCGVETGKGNAFCSNCGKSVAAEATVCLNCGVALNRKKEKNGKYLNGRDKTTMALICFFLGGIGVHNFMLGETKKGIFKIISSIIFCGIVGFILTIIDLVKILGETYVVDPEKLV